MMIPFCRGDGRRDSGTQLRKLFILAGGWLLVIVGILLTPAPVPIPLIGVLPLLVGCAILSRHSRMFRRNLQYLRHRVEFVSRWLEHFATRGPHSVRHMVKRTHPGAFKRYDRLRSRAEREEF